MAVYSAFSSLAMRLSYNPLRCPVYLHLNTENPFELRFRISRVLGVSRLCPPPCAPVVRRHRGLAGAREQKAG